MKSIKPLNEAKDMAYDKHFIYHTFYFKIIFNSILFISKIEEALGESVEPRCKASSSSYKEKGFQHVLGVTFDISIKKLISHFCARPSHNKNKKTPPAVFVLLYVIYISVEISFTFR